MIKHFFISTILAFFIITVGHSQSSPKAGYYLVVGAYAKSKKELANSFAKSLQNKGHLVSVDFFPRKNYYFVYIKYFNDFNASIRSLYQYRKTSEFNDCWVYVMDQSEVIDKARDKELSGLSDMFASRFSNLDSKEKEEKKESEKAKEIVQKEEVKNEAIVNDIEENSTVVVDKESPVKTENEEPTLPIYFSLFDARTQNEVPGEIELVNGTNHSKIGILTGNELIPLKDPNNGTGTIILISNVFGFKRKQLEINYYEPLEQEDMPYVTNIGDTVIVNFELQRYRKGDFMVMHNVFFFKDATVMRPESKYELIQLLEMMEDNASLEIKIHGHTNGNALGIIKEYDPETKNYFSLSGAGEGSTGSAKKLSLLRAETIKTYLVDNGINEKRMQVKGWGGKAMLHDKHDTQAKQNVRVEIEFITDY